VKLALYRVVDLRRRSLRRTAADFVTAADHARDAGQWELATQLYRKALDRSPDDPPIWVQYGHALKESGGLRDPDKLAQAEAAYRTALSLDPGAADTYLQLGHAQKLQGNTEEAQATYLRAYALDPATPYPLQELSGFGWSDAQLAELTRLVGRGDPDPANAPPDSPVEHAEVFDPEAQLAELTRLIGGDGSDLAVSPADSPVERAEVFDPEAQLAALTRLVDAPSDRPVEHAEVVGDPVVSESIAKPDGQERDLRERIRASGLFDPSVYLSLNEDLRALGVDPWEHFLNSGLRETRHFTSSAVVARLLTEMDTQLNRSSRDFVAAAERALAGADNAEIAAMLRQKGTRIGVFCTSEGNFFMREIADVLAWGLHEQGIEAVQRDETASREERFDLRVFVAPHEFFYLGQGKAWTPLAGAANSVLYNVEQVQTQWFCRAFPLLLQAPLVLDINFQVAEILRRAGCNVLHFMPGHLPTACYAQPYTDISDVALMKGYDFSQQPYDWLVRNRLDDRPIDILFIGSSAPRREKVMPPLRELSDNFRFVCIYTRQDWPLTERNHRSTSTEINCALGQRAKIVLNIHRDWPGYFEWSRMVMQGFWQGACVVCDPGMPNPIYQSGVHFLEENVRHIGELIGWLLGTREGREKLDLVRMAGYERACTLGSMRVALSPVLTGFKQLLTV
jgi:tetratricopeptide (TPR) repeat protein